MSRKLYRDLGFSSIRQYAIEALGFSSTRTGDFMRLAAKLESLPMVKQEVAAGRLGYTKAREIAAVADVNTEIEWVRVAREKSRRELEETVRLAKMVAGRQRKVDPGQRELMPRPEAPTPPAASSVRVGFEFSPTQFARYEVMLAKIGHRGDSAELLLEMMESFLATDETAPRGATGPHCQIHVHECPACAKITVQTLQGEKELTEAEAEAVRCDAQARYLITPAAPAKRRNTPSCPL